MAWQKQLKAGLEGLHRDYQLTGPHHANTPSRVVRAYEAMMAGYNDSPAVHLLTKFPVGRSTAMVHVGPVRIDATCAHHMWPIIGIAHFAYIPGKSIVGLSKIPRFIGGLARRLVVQEDLCADIVDVFADSVHPQGCAVWLKAFHCCMSARGVYEHQAMTTIMEVRGAFRTNAKTRQEFLANIDTGAVVIG